MFRTRWLNSSKIVSDEGFSIWVGQDRVVYHRDDRAMTMTSDLGRSEINIFTDIANSFVAHGGI
jgi:hypothetical protein